jgi:hypothetical protein
MHSLDSPAAPVLHLYCAAVSDCTLHLEGTEETWQFGDVLAAVDEARKRHPTGSLIVYDYTGAVVMETALMAG